MPQTMSSDRVRSLLEELAQRLNHSGVSAGVRVVGGAALAVLDVDRRATSDVDAVIVPAGVAVDVIATMAIDHDLPDKWLNDAALAYIPLVGSEDWIEIYRCGDVTVSIGSTPMLLAMKLFANRGIRDSDDIEFLLSACDIACVQDAQEIYERYHSQDVLSGSAVARIEHWLSRRDSTT